MRGNNNKSGGGGGGGGGGCGGHIQRKQYLDFWENGLVVENRWGKNTKKYID